MAFNGDDLYRCYGRYASLIGYVPQDDIIHRDLTVGEALYYSCRLRLPPDFSAQHQKASPHRAHQTRSRRAENVYGRLPRKKRHQRRPAEAPSIWPWNWSLIL